MRISRNTHKKPRHWCERSKCMQDIETVEEKDVWKLSPRMYWGGLLQMFSVGLYLSFLIAMGVVYFNPQFPDDDPYAPSYWETAIPAMSIATSLFVTLFLLSLVFTLPGKSKMKAALIPIRCQRCPKCFYDLSNRPRTDDTCPECGVIAPRRECVRLWCKLLRSRF